MLVFFEMNVMIKLTRASLSHNSTEGTATTSTPAMVLSALLPEFALYGFLASVMTQTWYFGLAVAYILWHSLTSIWRHRFDPPPLDLHVRLTIPAMTLVGAVVGVVFVYFFQPPRFVNTRLWDSRGRVQPWLILILIATFGATGSYYILEDGMTTEGTIGLVISVAIIIAVFVILFFFPRIVPDGVQQGKYLLLFSATAVLPAAYDYILTLDGLMGPQANRPWQAVAWAGAYVILFILWYVVVVTDWTMTPVEARWWRKKSRQPRLTFVIALFVCIALLYVPAIIADEIAFADPALKPVPNPDTTKEEQRILYVLYAMAVGAGVAVLAMGAWWAFGRYYRPFQMRSQFDAGAGNLHGIKVRQS